jgi:hypothetical protein
VFGLPAGEWSLRRPGDWTSVPGAQQLGRVAVSDAAFDETRRVALESPRLEALARDK